MIYIFDNSISGQEGEIVELYQKKATQVYCLALGKAIGLNSSNRSGYAPRYICVLRSRFKRDCISINLQVKFMISSMLRETERQLPMIVAIDIPYDSNLSCIMITQ